MIVYNTFMFHNIAQWHLPSWELLTGVSSVKQFLKRLLDSFLLQQS